MRAKATVRGRKKDETSVALFPFLAVLVCAMGALILLLVVLARQAEVQVASAERQKQQDEIAEFSDAREMAQWRLAQVRQSRGAAEQQLADARLRLGHSENQLRQLEARLSALEGQWKALARPRSSGQPLQEERQRLEAEIAKTQRQIADAQSAAASRGKSYSIIPYRGSQGTAKRPVYLECRRDAIVLQPEGIEFSPDDFRGPLGPENALARALRTAREHLAASGGEVYPLLVVRPDGIVGYYAAREALKSWGPEFGYELIGSDWPLRFPPADPQLATAVNQAVAAARRERRQLAVVAASLRMEGRESPGGPSGDGSPRSEPARGPKVVYRAAPGGGLIREEVAGGSTRRGYTRQDDDDSDRLQWTAGEKSGGAPGGGGTGTANPSASRPTTVAGAATKRPEDLLPGRPQDEPSPPAPSGEGVALRPGEWIPTDPRAKPPEPKPEKSRKSLAETRGKNWGLPDATANAGPITRPIRVDCWPDRLIVYADDGRIEQIVQFAARPEDSMDQLISAVWEHIKRWGIAGQRMYWKPILTVYVASGADHRFEELQTLLENSGLEVRRK